MVSAQHFFFGDIAQAVIDQVDSHPTLFALAQTNRAISDMALNKLWSSISTLYDLIRCIDPNLWEECETTGSWYLNSLKERTIRMRRSHYQCESKCVLLGDRFYSYAARVRHLEIRQCDNKENGFGNPALTYFSEIFNTNITLTVDTTVLDVWLCCSQYHTMLPNLQSLAFHLATWYSTPQYRQLIEQLYQRPISSLAISVDSNLVSSLINLLPLVESTEPFQKPPNDSSLKSIVVYRWLREPIICEKPDWTLYPFQYSFHYPSSISTLETTLTSLPMLRRVDLCSTLSLDAFQEFAAFPHLEWLKCHLPEQTDYLILPPLSFSSLRGISLRVDHAAEATRLLDNISSRFLEAIDFAFRFPPRSEGDVESEVSELFAHISHHCSRNSVELISLWSASGIYPTFTLPHALVQSLYGMPQLRCIMASIFRRAPSSDDILEWCSSLPALSYVEFAYSAQPVLCLPVVCTLLGREARGRVLPFVLRVDDEVLRTTHLRSISQKIEQLMLNIDEYNRYRTSDLARVLIILFPNLKQASIQKTSALHSKYINAETSRLNKCLAEYRWQQKNGLYKHAYHLFFWSKRLVLDSYFSIKGAS